MIGNWFRQITRLAAALIVASRALAQPSGAPLLRPATADVEILRHTTGPSWRRGESRHFIVYREQPVSLTSLSATIDSLEAAWDAAVRLIGQSVAETAHAYVFVTASRTRFAGFVPPEARGLTTRLRSGDDVVFLVQNDSVRAYVRHEVMHLVSMRAWGAPRGGAWLLEGLATFADGKCQSATVLAVARNLLEARPQLRAQDVVEQFLEMARMERGATYVLAGSLVDYLWSSRGREGVHRLWAGRDSLSDVGVLPGLGGELTAAWRTHVTRKAGSSAGLSPSALMRRACG